MKFSFQGWDLNSLRIFSASLRMTLYSSERKLRSSFSSISISLRPSINWIYLARLYCSSNFGCRSFRFTSMLKSLILF